ncbi:endonuclease/exonuclease/phosphatase family protein [Novosphingobium sp. SG720]|uniref:endonuclease/exonuclease/phosphatase family protein n=1 Tax=Novosphingobium sp. SG720 TaxID=2586998 RepID=UPI00144893C3|nr:endonuclease/exonuclease/phosphatase family protein [Novosphingobium sp. SG720]NKJ44591.1 endonuclease/exonuclease/phosphatase family metal-dependent hydrolase [Novosphingobium sp. SG720]
MTENRIPARLHALALLLAASLSPLPAWAAPPPRPAGALRVMSFNVRWPSPDDGINIWPRRQPLFLATIRAADPDVIGTQELYRRQGDAVVRHLPHWRWFGPDRFGGHADEHMGILYRHDRLRLLRHGVFWLSPTPDVPGSLGWGATLPRMVQWAVFQRRSAARTTFLMIDTHLANRDKEDETARAQSARMIAARLPALADALPVVLTADLNATPDSAAYATLTANLADSRQRAANPLGPEATFHDFTGQAQDRIDYILVRGWRVRNYAALTDHQGAGWPSDHFPILADLTPDQRESTPQQ